MSPYHTQIGLCLMADCVGMSVIWSAVFSFHFTIYHPLVTTSTMSSTFMLQGTTVISIIATVATWLYYAATEEMISTIAHLCAAVMGFVIGMMFRCLVIKRCHHQQQQQGGTREDEKLGKDGQIGMKNNHDNNNHHHTHHHSIGSRSK